MRPYLEATLTAQKLTLLTLWLWKVVGKDSDDLPVVQLLAALRPWAVVLSGQLSIWAIVAWAVVPGQLLPRQMLAEVKIVWEAGK